MGKQINMPKLRFPEFNEEWEKKMLGEVVDVFDGTHQTPDYLTEGIPFYSVEQMTANDFHKTKFVSKEVFDKENKRVKIERGDILMTRIGDIGTARYINWDVNASFYVSIVLIKQSRKCNSEYLCHFIGTQMFQNELWNRTIHVAFPKKINLGEISNCIASYPALAEQQKIATFLTSIDEKVTQLKKKKSLLEQYKKGVMQKIFSQEIRFKDEHGQDYTEWVDTKLGEIGIFSGGGTPSTKNTDFWMGSIPWISSSDLVDDSIFKISTTRFITKAAVSQSAAKIIPPKSVLIVSRVGVGKVAVNEVELCTSQDFTNIIPNSDNPIFIAYLVKFKTNKLLGLNQGTCIKGFVKSDLETMNIFLPSVAEQTKIANFLSAIDDKITHCSTQIEKMGLWKKGLMQKMFC